MTWFGYALITLVGLGGFLTITSVGETRKPVSPRLAALVAATDVLIIIGILLVGTNR